MFVFTVDQYEKFTVSKYMRILYENKCMLMAAKRKPNSNTIVVEVGDGIDIDFREDIYNPFIQKYEEHYICNR